MQHGECCTRAAADVIPIRDPASFRGHQEAGKAVRGAQDAFPSPSAVAATRTGRRGGSDSSRRAASSSSSSVARVTRMAVGRCCTGSVTRPAAAPAARHDLCDVEAALDAVLQEGDRGFL
jgi:hypothetical protein